MDNFIIGAANKAVSDNLKFLRAYEANPQAMVDAANASAQQTQTQDQMGGMLQFIMMMMLMQMMGANGSSDFFDTFPDYRDLVNTSGGGASGQTNTDAEEEENNPALAFIHSDVTLEEGQRFADVLKSELDKGTYTRKELRQALTQEAQQTEDPAAAEQAFGAITDLIEDHVLNPLPFMQESFLEPLSDDQYGQLLIASSKAGMPLNADGVPQPAFLNYLLSSIHGSEDSLARHFATRLIVLYGQEHGDEDSAQGRQVRNLMELTGIHPDPGEAATV